MTREEKPLVLVTGGAGYVGSHSVFLLLEQNYRVVVVDDCSNAYLEPIDANGNVQELPESLRRVEELADKKLTGFYNFSLTQDVKLLEDMFQRHNNQIEVVLHYAAFKSVSESISNPLEYYTNNLIGTINLLNTMSRFNCKRLIFSSSATVYGLPQYLPVDEEHQIGHNILNPYGRTKFMIEQILQDLCKAPSNGQQLATNDWNIIALRYFNPVGAHPSGYIGEHTQGTPNNIMPYIAQVSIKKRDKIFVFGNDFDTIDGTGVRDYIHIMDLASGHLHALEYMLGARKQLQEQDRFKAFNLGTGKGYSVLELIKTFELVNKVSLPFEITKRREGDAGEVYADASLANRELGWHAKYSLAEMCRDTYKWQSKQPDGYKSQSSFQGTDSTHK